MNPINHVAIIMDGNGRWGLRKKKSRNMGHKEGLNTVEKIIRETIKKKINNKILFNYFTKTNTTNFSKSRFVDLYSKNKIIGVYKLNDEEISKKQEKLFINGINKFAKKYDVIVVSDYGHGVFTNLVRKTIQKGKTHF